mgnify:CR=1 FL=1
MAVDYGIKIVKAGKDISTSDIRDILMSSKYSMLKFHSDSTGSVTVNAGDTNKYVEFSHNLGYVPAFVAYYKYNNQIFFIPNVPRSGGFDNYGYAWADTTKVRCGIVFPNAYNRLYRGTFNSGYETATGSTWPSGGHTSSSDVNGGWTYHNIGSEIGDNITIPQGTTISSALCDFQIADKGSDPGDVYIRTVGIDVDDVVDFGSDMGQTQTTAENLQSVSAPLGSKVGINVTGMVQEVVNRAGWANGNNLGFYIFNNGSTGIRYISTYTGGTIELYITKAGSVSTSFRCIIFKDKISS